MLRREGKGLLDVFSGIGVRQSVCSKDDEFAQPRSGVKSIAHGASRGMAVKSAVSPGSVTHGWRRGLCSVAAPQLFHWPFH